MRKLVTILQVMCFGLLLTINLYRLVSAIKVDCTDMETVVGFADTEEVKNTADTKAFMVEQEFHTNIVGLLMPEESAAWYIHHTTELPWQHGDALLLPPECPSRLS
ncbi:hypothetical protein D3H65_12960 [Paraflavitalea soli]|uniref:Uncharacterized protein n=1 Tax=Paraflavitalea soli TaxID=2315862 RepID=A0A3B7MM82_9BACT|nr:hypothetical protein [Paraflavitalea soli]AXY74837.1 hypothetical protein D3H65_12960 [Paraflavitalea soli]